MTMSFIPEMHDIGKMVDNAAVFAAIEANPDSSFTLSQDRRGHCFEWIDWSHSKHLEPDTLTWQGIRYHHRIIGARLIQEYFWPDTESKQRQFFLLLADHLAAAVARSLTDEIDARISAEADGVYRLWKPEYYQQHQKSNSRRREWAAAYDEESLERLLDYVCDPNCTSESFLRDYAYWLTLTPEDKSAPRNVTSLFTHVELVGKFYRALRREWTNLSVLAPTYQSQNAETIAQAELRWRYRLVECCFHFPQTLVRAVDLNVLLKRQQLMNKLQQQFGDNVLLRTADTVLLFLPAEESLAMHLLVEGFLAAGFRVDCRVAETALALLDAGVFEARGSKLFEQRCAQLNAPFGVDLVALDAKRQQLREQMNSEHRRIGMTARGDRAIEERLRAESAFVALQEEERKVRSEFDRVRNELKQLPEKPLKIDCAETSLHPDLADTIVPPLCEVCQMRPATMHWPPPDVETDLRDDVCAECFAVRNMGRDKTGKTFSNLNKWDEEEQSVDVAWVRFFLADLGTLGRIVRGLFEYYVDRGPLAPLDQALRAQAKENLRTFALLADFTNDYRALLDEFFAWVQSDKGKAWFPESHVEGLGDKVAFKDLYVLRVEEGAAIDQVIRQFQKLLEKYFPQCVDTAPVRLAISVSNVKYPYDEHWRFLEKPAALINLQMPTRNARLLINADQLTMLQKIELGERRTASGRFLHDLVEQERISGTRALPQAMMLEALHKEEKEMRAHRPTRQLPEKVWEAYRSGRLTARQILDYYKIIGW